MTSTPVAHLLLDTSSSNEDCNGDCDYCLVPLRPEYLSYLLTWMDDVVRLHQVDSSVNIIECWDYRPEYVASGDKVDGHIEAGVHLADDPAQGDPVLLVQDPAFRPQDYQAVECQTVQVSREDAWWTAYVKHTNIRIVSGSIDRPMLLRIGQHLGIPPAGNSNLSGSAHPALRKLYDLLYLDVEAGKPFYNPDKAWDAQTMSGIAEIVAAYIPRPRHEDL